jgi:3-hydroxybutyrate dehydrogenase
MSLKDKVALVTGSTSGIGLGIARALAAEGADLMLNGFADAAGIEHLRATIAGEHGVRVGYSGADISRPAEIATMVAQTEDELGRLDIMVNNAGGTDGWALVGDLSDEAWQKALNWNLNACFWGTRRALRYMVDAGWGRIINMSSVESKMANKAMVSHYITNKHAMNGLTKATAFEYAQQGITCNAICPGAIETDLMQEVGPLVAQQAGTTYEDFLQGYANESMIKRLNTVEEVAACAVWLSSDPGGGVTGAMINVDGGTSPW